MKKLIRYIKSVIHYHKTRRALNRGKQLTVSFKSTGSEEQIKELNAEVFTEVLITSVKYGMVLQHDVKMGRSEDDFITDLFTVRIKMWKL